ncbi:MAG: transcriptional regulator [Rhodoferax sp.]|uniref:ATP-binding protein n=1 Tax=Rhodoferax sp. TaxID=50421 RepID=UPI0013FF9118|nr:RNA-binding domain-containing protein [Rhodoferax sp.]NDP39323.1 transcriptional regulator [Rhodoferax sp.]
MKNFADLLDEFRRMPVETEWLEFKEAKNSFDTDALGRYVSALSNEANLHGREAGWLIFGVKNKIDPVTGARPLVGSLYAATAADLNDLKLQVYNHTSPSVGLSDPVVVDHPDGAPGSRVLMWRIPATAPGMPMAWKGHYYGRSGESLGALPLNKLDTLRAQSVTQDWSAVLATDDWSLLDPAALQLAQAFYKRRHATHSQVLSTLQNRSVSDWLHGLRLAVNGRLTRAALVLLGKPEAATCLGGPTPRLTWVLTDHTGTIQTHQHFDLPLIMAMDQLVAKLRIIEVSLLPPRQTAPLNLPNYDDWVIREALHNCIAHQDYAQGGRVRVTEAPDSLTFFNLGSFLPGTVERVLSSRQPELRYRNQCLANAMVELDLIETLNSGLPKMFRLQRERFFPLPDFEFGQSPDSVSVRIYGKTLDEKYVHALMSTTDLSLEEAILLDRVQKGQPLATEQIKRLRAKNLVGGRGAKIFISAQVAVATGQEVSYVNNKGLDAKHYKALVLDLLALGAQPRQQINGLLLSKLPASIDGDLRRKEYIKNLLQEMARDQQIENVGGATRSAKWQLKK